MRRWHIAAASLIAVLLVIAALRVPELLSTGGGPEARRISAQARVTQLATVLVAATNAETCSHGYVITGDAGFLAPFERALVVQSEAMSALESLYAGDIERGQFLRDVRDALASQREHMSSAVARRRALGAAAAEPLIAGFRGRALTDSVRAAVNLLLVDEQAALARDHALVETAASAGMRKQASLAGIVVLVLSLAIAALLRARRRSAQDVYTTGLLSDLDGRHHP